MQEGRVKKLVEFVRWWENPIGVNCIRCGELVEVGAKELDCEHCSNPGIWEENELAFELFQKLKGSMELDYQAMEILFKWYGVPIEERLELSEKIAVCWSEAMKMATKKRNKKAGLV